jgi:hypothetical protein
MLTRMPNVPFEGLVGLDREHRPVSELRPVEMATPSSAVLGDQDQNPHGLFAVLQDIDSGLTVLDDFAIV